MEGQKVNNIVSKSLVIFAILISIIGLLGWFTGKLFLAKLSVLYIPIAPSTAFSFLLLSAVLLAYLFNFKWKAFETVSVSILFIILLFTLAILVDILFNFKWDIEKIFIKNPDSFGEVVIGRMSPLTALLFILEATAVLLYKKRNIKLLRHTLGIILILSVMISLILIIGYLYKTPLLYGGTIIPVALPTAICFALIGIAIIHSISFNFWPFSLFLKSTPQKKIATTFLPIVIVFLILDSYLKATFIEQYHNYALVSAIELIIAIIVVSFIIIFISRILGASLQKAEKQLLEAKERAERNERDLNRAQEITHIGSWYLNTKTNEVTWTEELYKMYGFDPDKPVPPYTEHMKLFTPESWNLLSSSLAKTSETGVPYELELETVRIDKTNGWMWVRGEAVFNDKNEIIGLWGAAQDISESKRIQKKLSDNEFFLKKAQELGKIGTWELDIVSGVLLWTEENYKIFGVVPGTPLTFETFMNCIHPDDKEFVAKEWNSKMMTNNYDIEHRLLVNGQVKWVREKADVSYNKKGEPIFAIGFTQDITMRKLAEEKIRLKDIEFRKLSANVPDLIFQFTRRPDGSYVVPIASEGIKNIFGCSPEDVVDSFEPIARVIHPDDAQRVIEDIENSAKHLAYFTCEFRVKIPGRDIQWIYSRSNPEKLADGSITWYGFNVDITKIKKYEEELIKAKEKAEESDRLKSAFLANMSHEIRTPMNGILGFTSLLKEPGLDGRDQQRFVDIIERSGNRMLDTVNAIIDISKIDAKLVEVTKTPFDVNDELESLVNFFAREAESKGIELRFAEKLPAKNSFVISDKVKLNSIFTNLIKNAIKYTDKGSIKLFCKIEDSNFEFKIVDTGIGIPPNRIDSIFNRFEQADIEDRRAFEGSGLGLTIAKAYAEMLGGTISVESEFGKGSAFCFKIPWIKPKNTPEIEPSDSGVNNKSKKQLNILIAEDDDISFKYLDVILRGVASRVDRAVNGKEAVEHMKNTKDVSLILMDIKLPLMNGYKASKKIRKFDKDVVIVAQTAYALEGDSDKALEAGCNDYIAKPVSKPKLLELIDKHL
ncbi:PAS domain-containing protein [uncultured Draconibacterium sp.]|uniref:PAS domain-containing protein n=1 Tax=uncultured Draconibacterium sp. TaxID=1573823 RepID=UPI0032179C8F